ncbi:MAG: hypothetical protein ACERKD_21320 [Prolixibacteraceae bacterium]
MRLDYIANINEHGEDLVRLFEFKSTEAKLLSKAIQETLIENQEELLMHELEFIEVRNCYLTLRLHETDEGILTKDYVNFYCFLSPDGYQRMLKLMAPFCQKETRAHQFLYDLDIPTDFLFSPAGSW